MNRRNRPSFLQFLALFIGVCGMSSILIYSLSISQVHENSTNVKQAHLRKEDRFSRPLNGSKEALQFSKKNRKKLRSMQLNRNASSISAPIHLTAPNTQVEASNQTRPKIRVSSKALTHVKSTVDNLSSRASEGSRKIVHLTAKQIEASIKQPILVAIMTNHYFGSDYEQRFENCLYQGIVLDCDFRSGVSDSAVAEKADVLWYHIPTLPDPFTSLPRFHPKQLRCAMSMESSVYYTRLDDKEFMSMFELTMDYRSTATFPLFYFAWNPELYLKKPLPLKVKKNAVLYVNSNCNPPNNRHSIIQSLASLKKVEIFGYGTCGNKLDDANTPLKGKGRLPDKLAEMKKFKFCIAMENTNTVDYVSEKLWQAFEAGCVPIYWGAPNIEDLIPDPNAIINYSKLGSPESLSTEILRLMNDDAAYLEKLAWKNRKLEDMPASFQAHAKRSLLPHPKCQLCKYVAEYRLK